MNCEGRCYHDAQSGEFVHEATVTVHAPVEVCYQVWSDLERLPEIMRYLESVKRTGENTQRWEAEVAGRTETWVAETTAMTPNEIIAWRSTSGLENCGAVRFAPEGEGCRISVELRYNPPYGALGDILAETLVSARFQRDLEADLDRFKVNIEGGGRQHDCKAA